MSCKVLLYVWPAGTCRLPAVINFYSTPQLLARAAQGAAERADLNRRVFQRLNLGLLTLAGSAAALEAMYMPIFTPAGLAAGAAASLPALLVSGYHYHRTSGHGANPLPVLAVRPTVDAHALQLHLQWRFSLMVARQPAKPPSCKTQNWAAVETLCPSTRLCCRRM